MGHKCYTNDLLSFSCTKFRNVMSFTVFTIEVFVTNFVSQFRKISYKTMGFFVLYLRGKIRNRSFSKITGNGKFLEFPEMIYLWCRL